MAHGIRLELDELEKEHCGSLFSTSSILLYLAITICLCVVSSERDFV
jgi:hypothetical protein